MDWTDALKKIAPTLAAAALGPAGGAVISAIGSILGAEKPTLQSVTDAFASGQITPENLAEIKKLELQYQAQEKELGFKYVELQYKDVEGARNLAIQTKSTTPTVLSYGVLVGGGALIAAVMFGYAKVDSVLAGTLIGYVVAEMKTVLQFWFGSSQGSQNKDILLAQSNPVKPAS